MTAYRWADRARLETTPETTSVTVDLSGADGWRAWYDGAVYDSRSAGPRDLPASGLQVVMVYEPAEYAPGKRYRRLYVEADWYVVGGIPIRGTLIGDPEFEAIMSEAMAAEVW